MKSFFGSKKGFTLVELVVVIAIIGILAGIAIPQFMEATATARGAKIVAEMRTLESAEMIYYAKYGQYPTTKTDGTGDPKFIELVKGGWPTPPVGTYVIQATISSGGTKKGPYEATVATGTKYTYTPTVGTGTTADGSEPGKITLGTDLTLQTLLSGMDAK